MYQYRHIIQLFRQGESARQIARSQRVHILSRQCPGNNRLRLHPPARP